MFKNLFITFLVFVFSFCILSTASGNTGTIQLEMGDVGLDGLDLQSEYNEIKYNEMEESSKSGNEKAYNDAKYNYEASQYDLEEAQNNYTENPTSENASKLANAELNNVKAKSDLDQAEANKNGEGNLNEFENKDTIKAAEENASQKRQAYCDDSGDCIDRASFTIKVDTISPGMNVKGSNVKESVNFALGTIIQKLMIALGSFSLLIMTIGAGYIILNNGQDEILNKGKSIFMSGVYSLVVALSSYYLIAIVRYLLFQ